MSGHPEKHALRLRARAAVAALTAAERKQAGARLINSIANHPTWVNAEKIMLFSPLHDEPPVERLLDHAIDAGKTACLPRYVPADDHYEAAIVADTRRDLVAGRFGILEPAVNCASLPLKQLDLVLVPGVAFAPCGARLGRGRGFYDRILAAVTGARVGVAFAEQLFDAIPMESHDVRLTALITQRHGWLTIAE